MQAGELDKDGWAACLVDFCRDGVRAWGFPSGQLFDCFANLIFRSWDVKLVVCWHLGEASNGLIVDLCRPVEHAIKVFRPSIQDQRFLCQKGRTVSTMKGG